MSVISILSLGFRPKLCLYLITYASMIKPTPIPSFTLIIYLVKRRPADHEDSLSLSPSSSPSSLSTLKSAFLSYGQTRRSGPVKFWCCSFAVPCAACRSSTASGRLVCCVLHGRHLCGLRSTDDSKRNRCYRR